MKLLAPFRPRVKGGGVITAVADSPGQALYWALVSYNPLTGEEGAPLGSLRWNYTKADKSSLSCNIYMGPTTLSLGDAVVNELAVGEYQPEIQLFPHIVPGTLTVTGSTLIPHGPPGISLTDDGNGHLMEFEVVVGTINYETGLLTLTTFWSSWILYVTYSSYPGLYDRVKVKRANA